MAWSCTGKSNAELVNNLLKNNILKTNAVASAMKSVDRKFYVRESDKTFAYQDSPLSIGFGATISAPHMHAYAAEYLHSHLTPGAKVLDVGSGSGYLVALFWRIMTQREDGLERSPQVRSRVIGVEHVKQLTDWSIENLRCDGLGNDLDTESETRGIKMVTADGRNGYPNEAPYDVIHVGAASSARPDALLSQLANGGRMFIPVGSGFGSQKIIMYDKDMNGGIEERDLMGVRYVPLTDLKNQDPY